MPALSAAQLAVLKAAADGKLSRQSGYPYRWSNGHWDGPRSATCEALLKRGLISLDFDHPAGNWIPAPVTAAGRAVLDNTTPEGQS